MQYMSEAFDPIFGYSTLVRFTWKNVEKAIEESAVKCKWQVVNFFEEYRGIF